MKPHIRSAIRFGTGLRAWVCCVRGTPRWNALDIGYGITPRDAYYAWVRATSRPWIAYNARRMPVIRKETA